MTKENPLSKKDKISKRIEPELESNKYGADESKKIVEMVLKDLEVGREVMINWLTDRKKDLQCLHGDKPSIIETLTKKAWQSDRNLGMSGAICDTYQATLVSTCWNPGTIYARAIEKNDINNSQNWERFTKWAVGKVEADTFPEVDDFVRNRVSQGFSVFKIFWKVWYEWIDKRIPKKNGGYTIKTEKKRFEKGLIENISHLEDIIMPEYGKRIQDLPWFIEIIHKTSDEIPDLIERKIFRISDKDFIDKVKGLIADEKKKPLSEEKRKELGIADVTLGDMRVFPVDFVEWYGTYTKNGKTEKYRFIVEEQTRTLCAGKPLRKITRTGKIPYVGGPLIRLPGFISQTERLG